MFKSKTFYNRVCVYLHTRGRVGNLHSFLCWLSLCSNTSEGGGREGAAVSWYIPTSLTSSYKWPWKLTGRRVTSCRAHRTHGENTIGKYCKCAALEQVLMAKLFSVWLIRSDIDSKCSMIFRMWGVYWPDCSEPRLRLTKSTCFLRGGAEMWRVDTGGIIIMGTFLQNMRQKR